MTTDTLPTGLRIARDGEPGWFYKSPSVTLWVTDAVDKSADPIDTTLALPYSGNSTTGLDGGEDVDPDGTSEDDTYYDDTPTNDPNPELDPDYLAFLSDSLPVAPSCVTIGALSRAPHISSLASVPFNESDGQEPTLLQTPNLIERWRDAITKARDTDSAQDRREWLEEAQNLCERLVDAQAVCPCGVAYSLTTGRCEACDERHEQLMADRARMGAMALDVDPVVGF